MGAALEKYRAVNAFGTRLFPALTGFFSLFDFDNSRIQDTRHVIHPSRNEKGVSDETCPRIYPWGRLLQSKI